LCSHAVGFPKNYGNPTLFLKERGVKRVKIYTERYWSSLYESYNPSDQGPYDRRKN